MIFTSRPNFFYINIYLKVNVSNINYLTENNFYYLEFIMLHTTVEVFLITIIVFF